MQSKTGIATINGQIKNYNQSLVKHTIYKQTIKSASSVCKNTETC